MRRRDFIKVFAGSVTAWPLSANAQRAENLTRIGFLPVGTPSNTYDRSLVDAFRQGLREVGVIENRDVVLDIVWIGAEAELPQAAERASAARSKTIDTCWYKRVGRGEARGFHDSHSIHKRR